MRFMVMIKANEDTEAGVLPSEELLTEMGKYNEELVKAGVLLAGEGLQPSSKGARVRFSGAERTVIDGPFTEAKELIAGFWLLQVASKDEAIEWSSAALTPLTARPRSRSARCSRRKISAPSSLPSSGTRSSACAPTWARSRVVRDVGLAEDLAQDALVAALEQWPESGVPRNPGAGLMAVAKRRAIDVLRRSERLDPKIDELGHELETGSDVDVALDDDIGDDLLRLVFTACHPVLSTEARVALTLRLLGGLTTGEIARAFLVSESTVAQRIVRAKRTLTAARVPFEAPGGDERAARLSSVLEVVYLVFNEGYSATTGDE